jgi:hypothetical protein
MAKNSGPYFEFIMKQDGANIKFVFLPGNVAKKIFDDTKGALVQAFKRSFDISVNDYLREVVLEDGTETIEIDQSRIPGVLRAILEGSAFRDFKIKITGMDKDGNEKTKLINNSVEVNQATEVIPYYNKNNNDLTTKRRK